MNKNIVIAIDVMGSDKGIISIMDAVSLCKERHPGITFVFYGDDKQINNYLKNKSSLKNISKVISSPEVVSPGEKPSSAIRKRKTTR